MAPQVFGLQFQARHPIEVSPLASRPGSIIRRAPAFTAQKRRKLNQYRQASSEANPDKSSSDDLGDLGQRILSGEFTEAGSTREKLTRPIRKLLAKDPIGPGRWLAKWLADQARIWQKEAASRMPEARGDIREIVGQPVFVPLYKLFIAYGGVFRLSFGPKSFVIVSDPAVAKQVLVTNANRYSKGILSEILDFVMGKGLIPANGEIWRVRRKAVVPALHRKYLESMVDLFGECSLHGIAQLQKAADTGKTVEMENFFSRLTLDIIGKAVFNYEFDSLTHDDPVIQAVYTALREAEHRSTAFLPYWNLPFAKLVVPRQRRCQEAMVTINSTLDGLVAKCRRLVDKEDKEFEEEFLSQEDPSMLHFLLASGEEVSSQQLRDDLMTLLIAGHETTAAVLTWTLHCLVQHPEFMHELREEVDAVLGDRKATMGELRQLSFTTRVINESMRLYPQPPVLIRRAMEEDVFNGYAVAKGSDMFISVWNLHRSPALWDDPEEFNPRRFPLDKPVPNEITHNYAYLPFGGGKRKCIGDQFALYEAVATLAMLVRRFEFRRAKNAPPVNMTTGATIHTSEGLLVDVIPRNLMSPTDLQETSLLQQISLGNGHTAKPAESMNQKRSSEQHPNDNGLDLSSSKNGEAAKSPVNGSASPSTEADQSEQFFVGNNGAYEGMDAQNDIDGNAWQESAAADAETVKQSKQRIPGNQLGNNRSGEKEKSASMR